MQGKNPFLVQNQKQIQSWAPFMPVYRFSKHNWVYEIKPLQGSVRLSSKETWQQIISQNQLEINEIQDRFSGVSINRPIRQKQVNYEIQPLHLSLNATESNQALPYKMIDYNNAEMEPIQSYLPLNIIRVVYNREETSESFCHQESTPLPLPPTKIYSALRTRDTPQVPWSVQRPIFESFSFQSPGNEPVLQQEPTELVKPPKLPRK